MHVLIAGGGIAGSVTALALQQAGIEATIFEAHPRPTPTSARTSPSPPTGSTPSRRSVRGTWRRPAACRPGGTSCGTRRAPLGHTRPWSAPADGTVAQTIKRATLTRRLLEEAERRGIAVETGRRLVGATSAGRRPGRRSLRRRQRGRSATCSSVRMASTRPRAAHRPAKRLEAPVRRPDQLRRRHPWHRPPGRARGLAHDLRPAGVLRLPRGRRRRRRLVRQLAAPGHRCPGARDDDRGGLA